MAILALNTQDFEILTEQMLDDIYAAAADRYEVEWLSELPEERYAQIEIAFGAIKYDKTVLMPGLKWLQLTTAGSNHCNDVGKYPNPRFMMTNASGAFGEQIAEHVLAFFLGFGRGLHAYRDNQHKSLWEISFQPRHLKGSAVGVVGLGDLGMAVAKRCSSMGANVLAIKRSFMEQPDYIDELFFDTQQSLDALLQRSDYIALCLPLTDDTRQILDARRIALLRPGSVLANVGRGDLIDQQALIQRLQKGDIFAGLDVTTPEPLEKESPLWQLPNCWITPHMSGMSSTMMPYICNLFVDNLRRYISGKKLNNMVDFTIGY